MNQSIINIVIVIIAVVVLFGVLRFLNSGKIPLPQITENFEPSQDITLDQSLENDVASPYKGPIIPTQGNRKLMASELLPKDTPSSEWANANPEGSGSLKNTQFLQSGHLNGINTVGQTLRNANLQLRSDPAIPKGDGFGILQSTIEPDTNRRALEVGCAC
jgi:hypothetical protein